MRICTSKMLLHSCCVLSVENRWNCSFRFSFARAYHCCLTISCWGYKWVFIFSPCLRGFPPVLWPSPTLRNDVRFSCLWLAKVVQSECSPSSTNQQLSSLSASSLPLSCSYERFWSPGSGRWSETFVADLAKPKRSWFPNTWWQSQKLNKGLRRRHIFNSTSSTNDLNCKIIVTSSAIGCFWRALLTGL